jgi:hypothetical protein
MLEGNSGGELFETVPIVDCSRATGTRRLTSTLGYVQINLCAKPKSNRCPWSFAWLQTERGVQKRITEDFP